jgi:phytanoyl-CoA hydroxylase
LLVPDADKVDLPGALAQLATQGYARLGRLLDDQGLTLLRERAEALMLGQITYPGLFFQLDAPNGRYEDAPIGLGWQGPSLAYRKLEKLEKDPLFLEWLSNPVFERFVQARLPGEVTLYRAILFNKGAQGSSDIPWHQDGGRLWGLSQDPEVQLWTALDDAPSDGGCLEVVPGSHQGGLASPLGGVVPRELVEARGADGQAVALPVKAGEVIALHNLVWHRSGRNRPGTRRLGFSACYLAGTTRCLRKRGTPRQFLKVFPRSDRAH